MSQCTGSIIWFSPTKGFGFIRRAGGPDVFCHNTALRISDPQCLEEGAAVEFDLTGPDLSHADNVVLLKP